MEGRYHGGIFLDRLEKTRKDFGQYCIFPGREPNPTSPEQKAEVLLEIHLHQFTQFQSRGCKSAPLDQV
jgi:hypothetical protein